VTPAPAPRTVSVTALGGDVEVEVEDSRLREVVAELWRDLRRSETSPEPVVGHRARVDGTGPWLLTTDYSMATEPANGSPPLAQPDEPRADANTFAEAVSLVCSAINVPLATRGPYLVAHAAVVARAGTTLAIPGASGAGKTTLTVALLQRGWRYVSDEALAVDWNTGVLQPYPRPLGVSDWSAAMLDVVGGVRGDREWFLRPAELGAEVAVGAAGITHIVIVDRDRSAPTLQSAHRMDALEILLRRSFNYYHDPACALQTFAGVVRRAKVQRLCYGDPQLAASLLTDSFG
jgi:hypothetical protein